MLKHTHGVDQMLHKDLSALGIDQVTLARERPNPKLDNPVNGYE
jgi:hypothetical protein